MADEIKLKAPTVEQQVVVNINGEEKLRSFADTLDKISNNKNLQKYWKTEQELINATTDAYDIFQKKASKDNATELIKVTNALKAVSSTDLSNILPDFDKISKAMAEAQKLVGNIDSAFSVKGFKEAFESFETLKAYSEDIEKIFSHFSVSSDVSELQNTVRVLESEVEKLTRKLTSARNINEELRNEFENYKTGSGLADTLDELDNLKYEVSDLRKQAEETFNQFLKLNNITKDGYDREGFYDDNRFKEYFQNIQSGYWSASVAIQQFKKEYSYLLDDNFKSNNDTFGLEQLQAFSNKLDSIFRQVEETSTKINDIISNGVITKSVENLSMDSSLSDSQRSLFGNLLQDEESLKSITTLFQKLVEEINKTSNVDLFNNEQLQQVLSTFDKIENHLSSLRSIISDVGDGEEFSPLLKTINDVQKVVSNLEATVSKIKLNVNIETKGSDEQLLAKIEQRKQILLNAYRDQFNAMKKVKPSGADVINSFGLASKSGSTIAAINKSINMFDESEIENIDQKISAYEDMIKKMKRLSELSYGTNIYDNMDKTFQNKVSSAKGSLTKAINSLDNDASDGLGGIFGQTDLSGVISQLEQIVKKLEEISSSATEFKNIFKEGFNVTASVEEINKLTDRVKELEDELAKIKLNLVDINKPNVSSGIQIEDVFQGDDKATTDASTTAIKEESQALEQVSTSAKDAATSKEKFANANKEVKASADNSKTSISEEEKYFNSLGKSLTQYRNTLTSISRKPADGNRSQELQEKIDIISSSLKKLNALKSKTEENGYIFNKNDVDTGKQLEKTIKENIELVKQMSVAQKGSDALSRGKEIDTITKYLNKFTGISKEAKHELNGLLDKLQSGDPSVNVKKIHERFLELTVAERNAGREARNLFDIFKDKKIYSFLGQAASMFSFYDLINYGREGISTLKEFDDGLTKISYTMDMTKSKLNDLGKSVLEMANDLDSSIDNAMQVSQIYANMNTSAEEIKKLSEPTLILSNLTGFDASTVADDIQAVTQQFEIAAEDSMHIADVYDYISRNIAVDYSKFWSLYWKQYNENKSKSVKTKLFYN